MIRYIPVWMVFVFFISIPFSGFAESGDRRYHQKVTQPVEEAVHIRQATQKQKEMWRDEKQKLASTYEQLQAEQKALKDRQGELQEANQTTSQRIREKEKQLADIEQIRSRIEPFLDQQVALLRQQITDGLPFLPDERSQRLDRLEQILDDPDVTISEKYRKVMEAILVEAEYGNTIEVYQQTIDVGGHTMLANIFRLGSISLFYQSLDQSECGFYNVADAKWQELPATYNRDIAAAIDIGAKRQPVELLSLPLGRISVQ